MNNPSLQSKQFFSPQELAQLFEVHVNTIYALIRRGQLKSFRMGRSLRVSREAVRVFTLGQDPDSPQKGANEYEVR